MAVDGPSPAPLRVGDSLNLRGTLRGCVSYLLCVLTRRMVGTDAVDQDHIADNVIGAQAQDLLICRGPVPGSSLRHIWKRKDYHRFRPCAFEHLYLAALHDKLPTEGIQCGLDLVKVFQHFGVHFARLAQVVDQIRGHLKPSSFAIYAQSTVTAVTSIVIGAKR